MADAPTIRPMAREDVNYAIRLAAREGWNPGLSDAECFFEADPEGFFISELNGEPVATISAVRYEGGFGFVGLYIVTPEARGKGYGMALWDHAMEHLEGCNVGLDAVTEQEQTYTRSGFTTSYRSMRYEGVGGGARPEGVERLEDVDFAKVAHYDRLCFPGQRVDFLRAWFEAPGATGYAAMDGGRVTGFGVIRPCASGYKIGPLFADDADIAERIYSALTSKISGEKFYIDIIEPNEDARALVERHGLNKVFTTVRMYTDGEPRMALQKVFGVTSFELG